jgi:hypothetical protein
MNELGMRVVACCLSIDGEYYAGDQEDFSDNLDPLEQYEQGKYNMGIPCCLIHFLIKNHVLVSILITARTS